MPEATPEPAATAEPTPEPMFAKDDPSQILDAVMRLYTMKVSGLAYKNVFIKELPEEVINFANTNDFPILEFGGDEFFEDVIMQITMN